MEHILYGDGIHDDYPAIQEMINSGVCEVSLPIPKKHYLISRTLVLPSNFKLTLPRFAEIRLADGANCLMACNQMVVDKGDRLPNDLSDLCKHLWYYVNDYSPEAIAENIVVESHTDQEMPLMVVRGNVKKIISSNLQTNGDVERTEEA